MTEARRVWTWSRRKGKWGCLGCRMDMPCRHPVPCTMCCQLETILEEPPLDTIHEEDMPPPPPPAPPPPPSWKHPRCVHVRPASYAYGMTRMRPGVQAENTTVRAHRDRSRRPIPGRDMRVLVVELQRRAIPWTLSDAVQEAVAAAAGGESPPEVPPVEYIDDVYTHNPSVLRALLRAMLEDPALRRVIGLHHEAFRTRLDDLLQESTGDDEQAKLRQLHKMLRALPLELVCRNGYVVAYNMVSTAATGGSNTAMYPLGTAAQARPVTFYVVKYVTKDKVALSSSLTVLLAAQKHIEDYPSRAENTGDPTRTAQHFVQRVCNSVAGMAEYGAAQAAEIALGHQASWVSHEFTYVWPWDLMSWVIADVGDAWEARVAMPSTRGIAAMGGDRRDDALDEEVAAATGDVDEDSERDEEEVFEQDVLEPGGAVDTRGVRRGSTRPYPTGYGQYVLVDAHHNYLHRPPELWDMSQLEYSMCARLKRKEEAQTREPGGRGRAPNGRYRLPQAHKLAGSHEVALVSQHTCFILGGSKPPQMPKMPRPRRPTASWRKKADTFGMYILTLFRPYNPENLHTLGWGWNALCEFTCEIDPPPTDQVRSQHLKCKTGI